MGFRIELTEAAADSLRALPRSEQEHIARAIDELESSGLPANEDVHVVAASASKLTCIAEPGEKRISIMRIESHGHASAPSRVTARRTSLLADFAQDVVYALRTFGRNPGFALATFSILALGIGSNTALFSVANNAFLRALPFRDGERVVRIRNESPGPAGEARRFNVSPVYFHAIRDGNDVFDEVVAAIVRSYSLTGDGEPERIRGVSVSENWAPMLGIEPAHGRYFTPEEERIGHSSGVVVLSHGLWVRRFGGDEDVVGRSIVLDGRAFLVVGVMPPRFQFPYDADLWLPTVLDRDDVRAHSYHVLARLRAGVSMDRAQSNLDLIARSLSEDFPVNESVGLSVVPARDNFVQGDDEDRVILALLAAVGFLMLIACVNVANLLIARFSLRQHEISIRAALGAGSGRQLRQFLTETQILFLAGGFAGLWLTWVAKDRLIVLVPSVLSEQLALGELAFDSAVLTFTLGLSVAAGLVFGAIAAWRAARPDVGSAFKLGGRSVSSPMRTMQRAVIVAEVALAVILLTGAGLMIQHFESLHSRELGFSTEQLLTLRFELGAERYENADRRASAMRDILQKTASVPGVLGTGTTSDNPICCGDWGALLEIEGLERAPDAPPITAFHRYVTPGFFETMGIPLLRGRVFTEQDDARAVETVVIDERMAEHFWPGEDPIGKRVRTMRGESEWRSVIGVVGAIHDMGDYQDTWYLPFYGDPTARATENVHLMVRLTLDPADVVPGLRQAIREVDPQLAVFEIERMADLYDRAIAQDRNGAVIAGLFGSFGLLLAASGIYGVMSFLVGQRSREISTRIALGAKRDDVVKLVMRESSGVVIAGAALGLMGAAALNRFLASVIEELAPLDVSLLSAVAVTLVAVAAVASFIPARRASGLDPVQAFRA